MKEIQLKSIKEKYPIYFHRHIIIFPSEKFTGTKTEFLRRFINGNVDIESLGTSRTIFQRYHPGIFRVVCNTKYP